MKRKLSRACVLIGLAGVVACPGLLHAQVLEEVIVTAQKRAQDIQDVGIAVTAFSGDQMAALGYRETRDISAQTPGLVIGSVTGSPAVTLFNIRGVNQNDFVDHQETPVAVYEDEAYIASSTAVNFQMYDMERAEVLKGPQGTLFGRNTTGGLLHFVTRKPSDEFDAYVDVTGGSYDQIAVEGAVGGPLGERVAARAAFSTNFHDGYLENRIGADRHESNFYGGRVQLLWDITDDTELLVKAHYANNDKENSGAYTHLVSAIDPATGLGTPLPAPAGDLNGYRDNDGDPFTESIDLDGEFDREVYGFTGRLTSEFDAFTVTAISDYRNVDKFYIEDAESGASPLLNYGNGTDMWQFSQEVRLNGETERTRWVVGAYYLAQRGDYASKIWGAVPGAPPFPVVGFSSYEEVAPGLETNPGGAGYDFVNIYTQDKDSWSLFGQVEYDLTDVLTATAGVRYTKDDIDFDMHAYDAIPGGSFLPLGPNSSAFYSDSTDDSLVNWKAQLDWRPNDDWLVYFGVTQGTKGPGFSNNLDGQLPDSVLKYDSEKLINFEGGFKATLLDGRARLNTSLFHYDYQDYQAFVFIGLSNDVTNVDAKITGMEVELIANPMEGMDLLLGAAVLFDAEAEDVPFGATTFSKRDLPMSPDFTLNGMIRYEWPFMSGALAVQMDFNYVDDQNYSILNHPTTQGDDYLVGNARISYAPEAKNWELAFFVKNLADEEYLAYSIDLSGFGASQTQYGRPRWFGGQFRYNWK